eukprot:CAMPEP_0179320292 /NCGR_PEP_ID=MMETSP0797-20121207/57966_1 /TAXON_ID=47934 /ORGANISM="Dinophysis acuminata, Strain DAEP01" /LENGTH=184 /DNA_ID=CAMNT_0021031771 /DNA_START=57 /DNA_END=608 /DNA_ORIENTATION=+
MMSSPADSAARTGTPSGQMLGLFVLVVYVAIMPKELAHLACVFVGASGYLLFLVSQPHVAPHLAARMQRRRPGVPVSTGAAGKGPEDPAAAAGAKKPLESIDEVGKAEAVKAEATTKIPADVPSSPVTAEAPAGEGPSTDAAADPGEAPPAVLLKRADSTISDVASTDDESTESSTVSSDDSGG